MNLSLWTENFDKRYLYLSEPIKNFVLENAIFYKFIYSTPISTFNCLIFTIKFNNVSISKSFNKYKMIIDKSNRDVVSFLIDIEKDIINRVSLNGTPQYDLNNHLKLGYLKLYSKSDLPDKLDSINITLKLSGIWKTNDTYGLTYKFSI
jgi:hypothetical protein